MIENKTCEIFERTLVGSTQLHNNGTDSAQGESILPTQILITEDWTSNLIALGKFNYSINSYKAVDQYIDQFIESF